MQTDAARAWMQLPETPICVIRELNPRQLMTDEEKEAMRLLDLLKAGESIPDSVIAWSLRVTGDAIGLK